MTPKFRGISILFLSAIAAPCYAEPQGMVDEAGYATSTLDARVARLEKKVSAQPLTEAVSYTHLRAHET